MVDTEQKQSWFHCHGCGGLYRAEAALDRCPLCGVDPVTGEVIVDEVVRRRSKRRRKRWEEDGIQSERSSGASSGRRRKVSTKSKVLIGFVSVWVGLLAILLTVAMLADKPTGVEREKELMSEQERLDQQELARQSDRCAEVLAKFLSDPLVENRASFSVASGRVIPLILKHQQMNPVYSYRGSLGLVEATWVDLPKGRAIDAVVKLGDGTMLSVLFAKDGDEWRVDWEGFMKYSTEVWPLFVGGVGPSEGEFRLWARKRQAVNAVGRAKTLRLVLEAPKVAGVGVSESSPEIVIDPDSDISERLEEAFAKRSEGVGSWGIRSVSVDPADHIRVWVKLRRGTSREGVRQMEIVELKATDWVGELVR